MAELNLPALFIRNTADACIGGNDYDGRIGVRISAIFVILLGSCAGRKTGFDLPTTLTLLGAIFPVIANRYKSLGVPDWAFFIAKYFGSGVIIATAFIHVGCSCTIS
jgi:solute carrier family 39 (zinc transporter), member 1/2/3